MSSRSTSPNNGNDNTMNPPTNEPQQDGVPDKQSHDDEEQQRSLTTTSPPNQPSEDDTTAVPPPKPTPSEPMEHLQSSLEVAIARAHTTVNKQAAQQQNIKEVASVVHIDDSSVGKKATEKKAASSDDDNDGKNTKGKYRQRIKKYK